MKCELVLLFLASASGLVFSGVRLRRSVLLRAEDVAEKEEAEEVSQAAKNKIFMPLKHEPVMNDPDNKGPPIGQWTGTPQYNQDDPLRASLRKKKAKELRAECQALGISTTGFFDKDDFLEAIVRYKEEQGDTEVTEPETDSVVFSKSGLVVPGEVKELNGPQLEAEIQDASTPLLVDVYAKWCGPCQLMAPELATAAKTLGTKCRVAKLDSDLEPDLATKLQVGGLPTVLLFNNGKEVQRIEGAIMADQLVQFVTQYASS